VSSALLLQDGPSPLWNGTRRSLSGSRSTTPCKTAQGVTLAGKSDHGSDKPDGSDLQLLSGGPYRRASLSLIGNAGRRISERPVREAGCSAAAITSRSGRIQNPEGVSGAKARPASRAMR
jgi:hypothetical protein